MKRPSPRAGKGEMLRQAGTVVALCAGLAILAIELHRHYPLQHWLFFRYVAYWLIASVFAASCAAAGHATLRLLAVPRWPVLEHLAVAFALGVFEFQLALFAAGLARLYGAVLFVGLPAAFLALGGGSLGRELHVFTRRVRRARCAPRLGTIGWIVVLYGALCLVAIYLPTMLPGNSSFDARWRHIAMAEQYAVFGGIRRFPEGWAFGASPQFTSLLYAWAFMMPAGTLVDRVELCAHLEYVVFLGTVLVGIPAVVRKLVPRARPAVVWAARFVFPGVFLYDSSLSVGADHIGAVLGPALFLVGLRAFRAMDLRTGVLLGTLIAAAACAKETTALLLVPPPVLTVVLGFVRDAYRALWGAARSGARLWGAIAAGVTSVALAAPHWLKNLLWYGDPLYPNLHGVFAARPWGPDMTYAFEWVFRSMLWAPSPGWAGVQEALLALFTFTLEPQGTSWWSMHRDVPVFGSLFTLLLLALPFVRGARRTWALVAWVHVAIFCWYWVHHEERHLQTIVPLMAAGVAAIATAIWRSNGPAARAGLMALIGLQVVWGADVYFYPTHHMLGTAPIKAVADLLGMGFQGKYDERLASFQKAQRALGEALPPDAVVLLHESRDHLGIGRTTRTDFHGDQYGIDYARLATPDRVYARLRELGVTHVAWRDRHSQGYESLAGDIAFFRFAVRHTEGARSIDGHRLAAMPARPPAPPTLHEVAVIGCDVEYPSGVYELSDLRVPRFGPKRGRFPRPRAPLDDDWDKQVFAVAVDPACKKPVPWRVRRDFERVARRDARFGRAHEIWLRR